MAAKKQSKKSPEPFAERIDHEWNRAFAEALRRGAAPQRWVELRNAFQPPKTDFHGVLRRGRFGSLIAQGGDIDVAVQLAVTAAALLPDIRRAKRTDAIEHVHQFVEVVRNGDISRPADTNAQARALEALRRVDLVVRDLLAAKRERPLDAGDPERQTGAVESPVALNSGLRVSYHEALNGRLDLGLPRTPKNTLTAWCRNPQSATDLGVNPKGMVSAQRPLVEGLLRLHARKSPNKRPPQTRAK